MVMEAYVNGVSTRKADRLVEQLLIGGITEDLCSVPWTRSTWRPLSISDRSMPS
jgi:transposase-like protein